MTGGSGSLQVALLAAGVRLLTYGARCAGVAGRQLLTDEDFSQLKEDLIWEGSKVAYLNRNETLFLNAMSAYLKGTCVWARRSNRVPGEDEECAVLLVALGPLESR